MTDAELIARLREGNIGVNADKLAADRIEQLKHRLFQCATDLQIYMDAFAVSEAKLSTCEKYRDAYDEMGRIGTQAVRDLEAKLAEAVWLLTDAAVQLEAGKIKTRRNRAGLIWQFLEEIKST